jgi:hypothetical protein
MPAPIAWTPTSVVTLKNRHGYYSIDPYRLDRAMYEFTGVSRDRLAEILSEHTGCDYSDTYTMTELLIIAAETGLV